MNYLPIRRIGPENPAPVSLRIFVAAFVLLAGCRPAPDPMLDMLDTQLASYRIDSLSRSMELVANPTRFQKEEFEEKLAASLNRWTKADAELMDASEWSFDPLAETVVERFSGIQPASSIAELNFFNTDSYYLQQRYWMDRLGDRLIANRDIAPFELYRLAAGMDQFPEDEDPLSLVLGKLHSELSEQESSQLATTLKLFDWVIRNIHLLPDNSGRNDEKSIDDQRLNDSESLAAAGVPGTGYTRFPWQTMLLSRGDHVDRAKVFMMMIEQQGIGSLILLAPVDSEEKRTPWAVAVGIGERLFLFDTKLGLPIPGPQPGTIATLADVRADEKLLTGLDLSVNESLKDETEYRLRPKQLSDLIGGVYATPESISYRFWELENRLVAENRMVATTDLTALVKLARSHDLDPEIWDIGFQTHRFRRALRDAIAEAAFNDKIRDRLGWYYADELYVYQFVQYRTARSKYFSGLFETIRNDGNMNAIELFYKMIYKDSKIDSLATDKLFQIQMSLIEGKQSSSDFANTIRAVQENMRLVRRDSGFFLSQCHFDNGNFGTAANWLTRIEEIEDTRRWQGAVNYLRGRSMEAQRDYSEAIESYEKQNSEQFHGDLIRARMLKELISS